MGLYIRQLVLWAFTLVMLMSFSIVTMVKAGFNPNFAPFLLFVVSGIMTLVLWIFGRWYDYLWYSGQAHEFRIFGKMQQRLEFPLVTSIYFLTVWIYMLNIEEKNPFEDALVAFGMALYLWLMVGLVRLMYYSVTQICVQHQERRREREAHHYHLIENGDDAKETRIVVGSTDASDTDPHQKQVDTEEDLEL